MCLASSKTDRLLLLRRPFLNDQRVRGAAYLISDATKKNDLHCNHWYKRSLFPGSKYSGLGIPSEPETDLEDKDSYQNQEDQRKKCLESSRGESKDDSRDSSNSESSCQKGRVSDRANPWHVVPTND